MVSVPLVPRFGRYEVTIGRVPARTCLDARGICEAELMEGARRSTMDELANATAEADKVLIF